MFTSPSFRDEVQESAGFHASGHAYMFVKELRQAGHVRKFTIQKFGEAGWEVRDQQDERVLRQVFYTDWHRVERAVNMFNILIDDLESRGWAPTR